MPVPGLSDLHEHVRTHRGCGFEICESATHLVPGEGSETADVMIVGEAPGKSEDEQGRPFVGRSGKFLDELLAEAGLDRESVYITNVVKARPPGNRDPTRAEVEHWMQAKVDATDLVQTTLLEAYRAFDKFEGASEGEWLAWLRRILSHNATDFVRQYCGTAKRQMRRERPLQPVGPDGSRVMGWEPSAHCETPSQIAIRRECELEVAEAVERLPPDYREVIMLRNLQRLPFDEVARRMGRSRPATQREHGAMLRCEREHMTTTTSTGWRFQTGTGRE